MNKASKFFCLLLVILFWPKTSSAYQISSIDNVPISKDYVIGQGKNEVSLDPGEQKVKEVFILNRSGQDLNFSVGVEDFYSSDQSQEVIKFSQAQDNPYPVKNFLIPEVTNFSLKHGEQMVLPVLVKIPKEMSPGGLYGAVMISAQPVGSISGNQVKSTTRLASLFFIRVNGEIKESGKLQKFYSSRNFYNAGPVELSFVFKNDGNIYLNPHGEIVISNLWGKTLYKKSILPYFVMPGATRQQKELWQPTNPLGIYKATISLSRGYDDFIDRQSVRFYIFSWYSLIFFGVIALILVFMAVRAIIAYKKK